jgi:hypothetical protein
MNFYERAQRSSRRASRAPPARIPRRMKLLRASVLLALALASADEPGSDEPRTYETALAELRYLRKRLAFSRARSADWAGLSTSVWSGIPNRTQWALLTDGEAKLAGRAADGTQLVMPAPPQREPSSEGYAGQVGGGAKVFEKLSFDGSRPVWSADLLRVMLQTKEHREHPRLTHRPRGSHATLTLLHAIMHSSSLLTDRLHAAARGCTRGVLQVRTASRHRAIPTPPRTSRSPYRPSTRRYTALTSEPSLHTLASSRRSHHGLSSRYSHSLAAVRSDGTHTQCTSQCTRAHCTHSTHSSHRRCADRWHRICAICTGAQTITTVQWSGSHSVHTITHSAHPLHSALGTHTDVAAPSWIDGVPRIHTDRLQPADPRRTSRELGPPAPAPSHGHRCQERR